MRDKKNSPDLFPKTRLIFFGISIATNIFVVYKFMLKRPTRNIRFTPSGIVRKDYLVFIYSRFLYMGFCPNLIAAQTEGITLIQVIRTIS